KGLKVRIISASPKFLTDIQTFLTSKNISSNIYDATRTQQLSMRAHHAIRFLRNIYPIDTSKAQRLERKYTTAIEWINRDNIIQELSIQEFNGNYRSAARKFSKQFRNKFQKESK